MSDLATKPRANFAPLYCGLYPELAEIARKHGYALAIHGSLARDFDLICIPWVAEPSEPIDVIDEICSTFAIQLTSKVKVMEHNRISYILAVSFGDCYLDLSFMPCVTPIDRP